MNHEQVLSSAVLLCPGERNPEDDLYCPARLTVTQERSGSVKVRVVGFYDMHGALAPTTPDDIPYVEITLASDAAGRLATQLTGQADEPNGHTRLFSPVGACDRMCLESLLEDSEKGLEVTPHTCESCEARATWRRDVEPT